MRFTERYAMDAARVLVLGVYPRISALALLFFLTPATLMAHAFWQATGPPLYPVQLISF
jgi:putative oxidoreductase